MVVGRNESECTEKLAAADKLHLTLLQFGHEGRGENCKLHPSATFEESFGLLETLVRAYYSPLKPISLTLRVVAGCE